MPLLVRGCRRQRSKGQLLTSKDVGSEEGMRGSGWPRGGFWSLGDMRYGPCPLIHWTLCLHQFSLPVSWDGYEDKARQHMLKIVKLWRATDYRWDSRKNLRVIPHSQYISCFFGSVPHIYLNLSSLRHSAAILVHGTQHPLGLESLQAPSDCSPSFHPCLSNPFHMLQERDLYKYIGD